MGMNLVFIAVAFRVCHDLLLNHCVTNHKSLEAIAQKSCVSELFHDSPNGHEVNVYEHFCQGCISKGDQIIVVIIVEDDGNDSHMTMIVIMTFVVSMMPCD